MSDKAVCGIRSCICDHTHEEVMCTQQSLREMVNLPSRTYTELSTGPNIAADFFSVILIGHLFRENPRSTSKSGSRNRKGQKKSYLATAATLTVIRLIRGPPPPSPTFTLAWRSLCLRSEANPNMGNILPLPKWEICLISSSKSYLPENLLPW